MTQIDDSTLTPVLSVPDGHPVLARAEERVRALTRAVATAGAGVMLAIALLMAVDVSILRAVLGAPLPASNEIYQIGFAIGIAATLAGGLSERSTLQVDMLGALVSARTRLFLQTVGAFVYLFALAGLVWGVALYAVDARESQALTTILRLPTWPMLLAVTLLMALTLPAQLMVALTDATRLGGRGGLLAGLAGLAVVAGGAATVLAFQPVIQEQPLIFAAIAFGVIWLAILLLIPVAAALLTVAGLGIVGMYGVGTATEIAASEMISLLTSSDLAIIPLFLMMGGFAVMGGMSADIFRLAQAVFAPIRGGLAMATIGGCAGFGALTGSSVATVATIGGASYPEMQARGYSRRLATGSIAAGGTLGQLIPPSTAVVVYALLVEQSIGVLYIAILVPAFLTVAFYILAIAVTVRLNPDAAPAPEPWRPGDILEALRHCGPVFLVFALVIGGIFLGIFTATEAAGVGAILAFLTALWRRALTGGRLWRVASETVQSTSMLYFVIAAAMVLTFFMSTTGAATAVTDAILSLELPPLAVVFLLALAFILLGSVMDSMTIMMITASTLSGVIASMGYDLVWWGVVMVMLVELGVITPPFGINLFVMKGVAPDARLTDVYRGVMPFVWADLIKLVLLILVPAIVLWLPSLG